MILWHPLFDKLRFRISGHLVQNADRAATKPSAPAAHVFFIGGMKCGTWTLFKLLRKHPQISASSPKELKFFTRNGRDAWHRYHENFGIKPDTKVLLDGTTQYSKYPDFPDVAYKISLFDPQAKFIYLMRDPVRRVESQLAHRVARREIRDGNEARAREIGRAIHYSRYYTQAGIYANLFGVERIYMKTFESFVADQERTVREICEFLGIEQPKVVKPLPPQNARKPDNGASEIALTVAEKRLIRERLKWEIRCLEVVFGVQTAEWKDFWGDDS